MKHYTVVAAVIEQDGRLIAMQRGETRFEYTSHKWEFPGGKVEPGETEAEALAREIREEMALEIVVGEKITEVDHAYPDFEIHISFYACRAARQNFERIEHEASCRIAPSQLHSLDWAAADARAIDRITQYYI